MNTGMTKSQKKRQRLVRKGVTLGERIEKGALVPANAGNRAAVANQPRRRRNRKRNRQARLTAAGSQSKSNYLYALMNPEDAMAAKIPDEVTFPSSTFQLEQGGTLPIGAGTGDSAAIFVTPISADASTTYPITVRNGASVGNLGTVANQDWTDGASIRNSYAAVRCVSCVLSVYFVGPSTSDQGTMYAGCTYIPLSSTPGLISTVAAYPEMAESAARDGARVLWKPLDTHGLTYLPTGLTSTQYSAKGIAIPQLVVAVDSQNTSSAYYRYHIVCNFEGIPKSDNWNMLSPTPSPYDEATMKRAIQWIGTVGNNVFQVVNGAGPYLSAAAKAYEAIGHSPVRGLITNFSHNYANRLSGASRMLDTGSYFRAPRGLRASPLLSGVIDANNNNESDSASNLKDEIENLRAQLLDLRLDLIKAQGVVAQDTLRRTTSGNLGSPSVAKQV